MVINVLLLLTGFAILIKGADFLVDGASSLAKKFNISNLAIGLTVVAFGTSTPELVVNTISSLNGQPDAAFGNIIGSNNFNLLLILGVSGVICPLVVQRSTVRIEIPVSLVAIIILFFLVNDVMVRGDLENILSLTDALILISCFLLFLYYIYRNMKKTSDKEAGETIKIFSNGIAIALVAGGLVMLVLGGKLAVDNAVSIAHSVGLSEKLIGLTILAAGTSLPELATSAMAAYKRNTDIAIGNVVGSNIFNVLFILGVTGMISPVPYNVSLNFDMIVSIVTTIVLIIFMFTLHKRKLDRWEALVLLAGYIAYTVYLIVVDA